VSTVTFTMSVKLVAPFKTHTIVTPFTDRATHNAAKRDRGES
jgi:hypothetical protein